MTKITNDLVKHISRLANIPITDKEEENLKNGFNTTLKAVDELFNVDTEGVPPTHQVTGLENVFREDRVNEKKMFTQDQALKNTKRKHNGYFVVDQIMADD